MQLTTIITIERADIIEFIRSKGLVVADSASFNDDSECHVQFPISTKAVVSLQPAQIVKATAESEAAFCELVQEALGPNDNRSNAIRIIRHERGLLLKDAKEWLDKNFPPR